MIPTDFTVFDLSTGEIRRSGSAPLNMVEIQLQKGEGILTEPSNDATQYVDLKLLEVRDKPLLPGELDRTTVQADNMETATLSGLPLVPVTFTFSGAAGGEVITIDDGLLEVTFKYPGEYFIRAEAFPYLPREFTINAV